MDPIATPPLSAYIGMALGLIVCLGFCLSILAWALVDCLQREFINTATKVVWLIIVLLLVGLGPIAYLIMGRRMGVRAGPPP